MEGFKEFKLIAGGQRTMAHHIMKVQSKKFDIASLKRPVHMFRHDPLAERKAEQERLKLEQQEEEPSKPKMDESKVAPFGAAIRSRKNAFKKKTKTYIFSRDNEEADNSDNEPDPDALIPSIKSRLFDPDKNPWILQDSSNDMMETDDATMTPTLEGKLEGAKESSYVLFVFANDAFKVIPTSKFYKFVPKVKYRTLTVDEAEEEYRKKKKVGGSSRWNQTTAMLQSNKPKSKLQQLREMTFEDSAEQNQYAKSPKKNVEEEIDYEEDFADDEELNLGLEDEEDAKEASKRVFDDDPLNNSFNPSKLEKKLTKSLIKLEQNDIYDDFDDDNPYISDMDDEEEEDVKLKVQEYEKPKATSKRSFEPTRSDNIYSPAATLPPSPHASSGEPKRRRLDTEESDSEAKQKRTATSSPTQLLTENDVIQAFRGFQDHKATMKEIVASLRSIVKRDEKTNKDLFRKILKAVAAFNKETGVFRLKSQYR